MASANVYDDLHAKEILTGDLLFYVEDKGLPYAEISIASGATVNAIPTGTTYKKATGFTTNGKSNNCTADATNDKITITKEGVYQVHAFFNGKSGSANTEFFGAIHLDAALQSNMQCRNEFVAADKNCTSSVHGIIDVKTVPADLDFRLYHDDGGSVNFTIVNANINVVQIGG